MAGRAPARDRRPPRHRRRHRDPARPHPHGGRRRGPRPDGPQRLRASPRSPTPCSPTPPTQVTGGRIRFQGEDITALPTDERAARGIFLGFQHPEEIPGVSVLNFLRQALAVRKGIPDLSVLEVRLSAHGVDEAPRHGRRASPSATSTRASPAARRSATRSCRWRMMEPDLAVLDETDCGLDIDALRTVAHGINEVRAARPDLGILLITHYQRILDHLTPDVVHVLLDGRIVATGGPELARRIEADGFDAFRTRSRHDAPTPTRRRRASRPTSRSSKRQVHGKRLVYLDSAATSQKPLAVLDAMDRYYRDVQRQRAPRRLHDRRGDHRAPSRRPGAKVARFVDAPPRARDRLHERNATEAINLVAYSWARANLREGDVIVLTEMEHHANIVPWHILAAERGVELRWIPLTADYRLDLTDLDAAARRRQAPRDHRDVERARHHQRRPPARRRRPRRRRARARRRLPGRAAPRRSTCRRGTPTSSAFTGPQDARPDRHRRAVGPRASCSRRCRRSSAAAR